MPYRGPSPRELDDQLDARALEGVSVGRGASRSRAPVDKAVIVAALVTGTLAALLILPDLFQAPIQAPARSQMLVAGTVVSSADHGDRCTIAVSVKRADCTIDIDVVCPRIERRYHTSTCIEPGAPISTRTRDVELDGASGRLVFEHGTREVRLEAWR